VRVCVCVYVCVCVCVYVCLCVCVCPHLCGECVHGACRLGVHMRLLSIVIAQDHLSPSHNIVTISDAYGVYKMRICVL
jgi:hypothetical protein